MSISYGQSLRGICRKQPLFWSRPNLRDRQWSHCGTVSPPQWCQDEIVFLKAFLTLLPWSETLGAPACWKNKMWSPSRLSLTWPPPPSLPSSVACSFYSLPHPPTPKPAQHGLPVPTKFFLSLTSVLCCGYFPAQDYCFLVPTTCHNFPYPQTEGIPLPVFFRTPLKCSHLPPSPWGLSLPSCAHSPSDTKWQ